MIERPTEERTTRPYLTVDQAADLLQVHPETVRRWLRRGRLPNARKVPSGHGWRIPRADLDGLGDI